jgi:hypothetical protein
MKDARAKGVIVQRYWEARKKLDLERDRQDRHFIIPCLPATVFLVQYSEFNSPLNVNASMPGAASQRLQHSITGLRPSKPDNSST